MRYNIMISSEVRTYLRDQGQTAYAQIKTHLHASYTDNRPPELRALGFLADHVNDCGAADHATSTLISVYQAEAFMDFIVTLNPFGESNIVSRNALSFPKMASRFLEGLALGYYESLMPRKPRPRQQQHSHSSSVRVHKPLRLDRLTPAQLEDRLLYVNLDLSELVEGANETLERERDIINDLLARISASQHLPNC